MFKTAESDYNIVDATPFGRDVLKELSEACQKHDISLHFDSFNRIVWVSEGYAIGTGETLLNLLSTFE